MIFTLLPAPRARKRLTLWLVALIAVAATAAIYHWLPRWVPAMRAVTDVGAVVIIVWLLAPKCKRSLQRRLRARRDSSPRGRH